MNSAIYSGKISHRRHLPTLHEFEYSDTMFYLDLEELSAGEGVLKKCSGRFRKADHFSRDDDLAAAVRELVRRKLGFRPKGRIGILTHIRQLGYVMNPVSFYYCWSENESCLEAIVAEVHNTPWGETHCYAFRCVQGEPSEFRFSKGFHVSPFMGMEQEYVWRFEQPGDELFVTMENWEGGALVFEARLALDRQALTEKSLRTVLLAKPFMTVAVITRIYWQAAQLWVKRVPYFAHPRKALKAKVKR